MSAVTFIVPAYNEEDTIERCLSSVKEQDFDGGVEVLVVDDGSTDKTQEIARRCADRVVVNDGNGGLAHSLNRGIKEADTEFVCMLQADCVLPDKDWLDCMYRYIEEDTEVAMLASWPVIPQDVFRGYTVPARIMYGQDREDGVDVVYEENTLLDPIKANICRKELLLDVGCFNEERYVTAGEDLDLCLRLRRSGYRVDRADTSVNHLHGQKSFGTKDLFRKKYQYSEAQGVLKRFYFSEYELGVWNEATKGVFYVSLAIPPINTVTLPLFLVYIAAFTYSYRKLFEGQQFLSAIGLKVMADLFNIGGFVKGFVTAEQKSKA